MAKVKSGGDFYGRNLSLQVTHGLKYWAGTKITYLTLQIQMQRCNNPWEENNNLLKLLYINCQ